MKEQFEPDEVYRIRGTVELAKYKPQSISEYGDNPLIEALPEIWEWDGDEPIVANELTRHFCPSDSIREAPSSVRLHTLGLFKLQFFQVLNRVRDLEQSLSILIRNTYLGRNPLDPRHRRNLHDRVAQLNADRKRKMITVGNLGFTLLGAPGLGKTRTIERIIQLYPQVILHENYPKNLKFRHTQVTWLYLTCSHVRSARGLCLAFFQEVDAILGTRFYQPDSRDNADTLLAQMANVAATISLGVLFIDEIQFLTGGDDALLKFLVQLENTLRIAIVVVGTCKAVKLVAGSPHLARRSSGTGGRIWLPFKPDDFEWAIFLETMWQHQYLRKFVQLNPDLIKTIYEETWGIPSYAVDLFYSAQCDAINNRTETITVDSLRSAARDHQVFNRPYVHALRTKNCKVSKVLRDIIPPNLENCEDFWRDELQIPPDRTNAQDVSVSGTTSGVNSPEETPKAEPIPSFQPPGPGPAVTGIVPKPPKRRKGKTIYPQESLMGICASAYEKEGRAPYEALKAAGLIQNLCDFLQTRSPA